MAGGASYYQQLEAELKERYDDVRAKWRDRLSTRYDIGAKIIKSGNSPYIQYEHGLLRQLMSVYYISPAELWEYRWAYPLYLRNISPDLPHAWTTNARSLIRVLEYIMGAPDPSSFQVPLPPHGPTREFLQWAAKKHLEQFSGTLALQQVSLFVHEQFEFSKQAYFIIAFDNLVEKDGVLALAPE